MRSGVMMQCATLCLSLDGTPAGKGRPRFTRAGRVYTPEKTRAAERAIQAAAARALAATSDSDARILRSTDARYVVRITAFFAIPRSWTKAKQDRARFGLLTPGTKPDADNIAKLVLDALQPDPVSDDAKVTELAVTKIYAERPSVQIVITAVTNDQA